MANETSFAGHLLSTPYRPSNGDEGMHFQVRFCEECEHEREWRKHERNPCQILGRTMAFDIDDPDYPKEWIEDADGPRCMVKMSEGPFVGRYIIAHTSEVLTEGTAVTCSERTGRMRATPALVWDWPIYAKRQENEG